MVPLALVNAIWPETATTELRNRITNAANINSGTSTSTQVPGFNGPYIPKNQAELDAMNAQNAANNQAALQPTVNRTLVDPNKITRAVNDTTSYLWNNLRNSYSSQQAASRIAEEMKIHGIPREHLVTFMNALVTKIGWGKDFTQEVQGKIPAFGRGGLITGSPTLIQVGETWKKAVVAPMDELNGVIAEQMSKMIDEVALYQNAVVQANRSITDDLNTELVPTISGGASRGVVSGPVTLQSTNHFYFDKVYIGNDMDLNKFVDYIVDKVDERLYQKWAKRR
jgi:hypothetical protein